MSMNSLVLLTASRVCLCQLQTVFHDALNLIKHFGWLLVSHMDKSSAKLVETKTCFQPSCRWMKQKKQFKIILTQVSRTRSYVAFSHITCWYISERIKNKLWHSNIITHYSALAVTYLLMCLDELLESLKLVLTTDITSGISLKTLFKKTHSFPNKGTNS